MIRPARPEDWAEVVRLGAETPEDGEGAVDWISAGQDWASRVCFAARLELAPYGPYFTRGRLGPLRPWLPSGPFL